MKKVFLTVLTVVLFSVSGWANNSNYISNLSLETVQTCYVVAAAAEATYKSLMGENYTDAGGYAVFSAAFEACENDSKLSSGGGKAVKSLSDK